MIKVIKFNSGIILLHNPQFILKSFLSNLNVKTCPRNILYKYLSYPIFSKHKIMNFL